MGIPVIGVIGEFFPELLNALGDIIGQLIDFIIGLLPAGEPAAAALLNFDENTIQGLFQELKMKNQEAVFEAGMENLVGFTHAQNTDGRNWIILTGIFNKKTNKVIDAVIIPAENLSDEVASWHRHSGIVFYN